MLKKGFLYNLELEFQHNPAEVWSAITDPEHMRKWFFENISAFRAEEGFLVEFPVYSDKRLFTHLWEIIRVVPGKFIKYSWRYKEYKGDSIVSFDVLPCTNGTLLRFSLEVLDDFPSDISEFQQESCVSGWNYFLNDRLNVYLKSKT